MKKIKEFYNKHRVISWVVAVFIGLALVSSIINNDFENLTSMVYSLGMLCVYLYILYILTSRKTYVCPKCKSKINKKDSCCKKCGEDFNSETKIKPTRKRVLLKSKLFCMLGEGIAGIPLGLGFLYLIISPIVFATNGESFSAANTLFVCYTKPGLYGITVPCSIIGFIFILVGLYYKKKEQ